MAGHGRCADHAVNYRAQRVCFAALGGMTPYDHALRLLHLLHPTKPASDSAFALREKLTSAEPTQRRPHPCHILALPPGAYRSVLPHRLPLWLLLFHQCHQSLPVTKCQFKPPCGTVPRSVAVCNRFPVQLLSSAGRRFFRNQD